MNWHLLLSITLTAKDGFQISIGPVGLALILIIGLLIFKKVFGLWSITAVKFNLDFKNPISIEIKPNHYVRNVAHKVWTELQTRKAALPFDEKNDVITEVYDSWYSMFGIIRELIKSLPAEHLKKDKDTAELVSLLINVLNHGLRPHLTRWQARFRKWIEKNPDDKLSPQELQKGYPEYDKLIKNLKKVNTELQKFSNSLYELIYKK